jgi:hypothetical protein
METLYKFAVTWPPQNPSRSKGIVAVEPPVKISSRLLNPRGRSLIASLPSIAFACFKAI